MNKKIVSAEFPEGIKVVYFANLTIQIIVSWFKNFGHLLVENDRRSFQDREYIGFTIWRGMERAGYQIVQGIFASKNQKVYDARVIQASSVDLSIKQAHGDGKMEVAFWQ
ncbi:MAG TPA: hypothetical protein DDW76_13785 [Cyanobacteria bacterium UBA11369]|nr:hypothetical protein [Cyanobacteria bacterium UBA11369]